MARLLHLAKLPIAVGISHIAVVAVCEKKKAQKHEFALWLVPDRGSSFEVAATAQIASAAERAAEVSEAAAPAVEAVVSVARSAASSESLRSLEAKVGDDVWRDLSFDERLARVELRAQLLEAIAEPSKFFAAVEEEAPAASAAADDEPATAPPVELHPPHVALGPSFLASKKVARGVARTAAHTIGAGNGGAGVPLVPVLSVAPPKGADIIRWSQKQLEDDAPGVTVSPDEPLRAAAIELVPSQELRMASTLARMCAAKYGPDAGTRLLEDFYAEVLATFRPHVAILRGTHGDDLLAEVGAGLRRDLLRRNDPLGGGFVAHTLALVKTEADGNTVEVERFSLSPDTSEVRRRVDSKSRLSRCTPTVVIHDRSHPGGSWSLLSPS